MQQKKLRDLLQHSISHRMSVPIVYFLKVIEVDHQYRQRKMIARTAYALNFQHLAEAAAVGHACQRVCFSMVAKLLTQTYLCSHIRKDYSPSHLPGCGIGRGGKQRPDADFVGL